MPAALVSAPGGRQPPCYDAREFAAFLLRSASTKAPKKRIRQRAFIRGSFTHPRRDGGCLQIRDLPINVAPALPPARDIGL